MIRIKKSNNIPAKLAIDGVQEANNLQVLYTANPNSYTSRAGVSNRTLRKFEIDETIYGDLNVKRQLINEQHNKCCFCESKFSDNSYGDIEHFRPKKAYNKYTVKGLIYPGYYWIAYDWKNLMFSCEICNRKYKKNFFPLADENTRVKFHNDIKLLQNEATLLINPITENPSDFIKFEKEIPKPKNNSLKGKISIKLYGLERLNNTRLEYILLLEALLAFKEINKHVAAEVDLAVKMFKLTRVQIIEKIDQANIFFNNAAKDNAKFALCIRDNFPHLPK